MATYLKSMRYVSRFRDHWYGDLVGVNYQESGSMLVAAVPLGKRYLIKGDIAAAATSFLSYRVNLAIGVNGTQSGQYIDSGDVSSPLMFSSPFANGSCNGFFKSKFPSSVLPPLRGQGQSINGDQTSSVGTGCEFEFIAESNEQVHCRLGISRQVADGIYSYGADIFIYEIN